MVDTLAPDPLPTWPFYGYAPGTYSVRCIKCGEQAHCNAKRSIACLECAVKAAKADIATLQGGADHEMIEKLLSDLWSSGDWTDDHEAALDKWRAARGEAAMDKWQWWVGEVDGESYSYDAETRDEAITVGQLHYAGEGSFWIVEARQWADNVKEGDDISWFAQSRNQETIPVVRHA